MRMRMRMRMRMLMLMLMLMATDRHVILSGAERRWRHTIGAADAATMSEAPDDIEPRQSPGVGPFTGRRGEAPVLKRVGA